MPEGAGAAGWMPLGGQQAGKAACRARKPRALSCIPGLPIAGRSSPGAPQTLSTSYSGRAAVEVLGAGAVSPTPRDRQAEPFVLSAGWTPGGRHSARLWPVALVVTPRALDSQPLYRFLPKPLVRTPASSPGLALGPWVRCFLLSVTPAGCSRLFLPWETGEGATRPRGEQASTGSHS